MPQTKLKTTLIIQNKAFECSECHQVYSRKDRLTSHMKGAHSVQCSTRQKRFKCPFCSEECIFYTFTQMKDHCHKKHGNKLGKVYDIHINNHDSLRIIILHLCTCNYSGIKELIFISWTEFSKWKEQTYILCHRKKIQAKWK